MQLTASTREAWRSAGFWLVFVWFLVGGIGHFVWTNAFVSVVPPYVPFAYEVVLVTGVLEIAGALALLTPSLRRISGYALMAFAVCVTPVHVDMLMHAERYPTVGLGGLWLRLAMQPVLIWIIWVATKPRAV